MSADSLLVVPEAFDQQGVEVTALGLDEVMLVLDEQPPEKVAQGGKAGSDQGGMLGPDGESQALENRRNCPFGDILLFDVGFETRQLAYLGVDRVVVALQQGHQFGRLCLHDCERVQSVEEEETRDIEGGEEPAVFEEEEGMESGEEGENDDQLSKRERKLTPGRLHRVRSHGCWRNMKMKRCKGYIEARSRSRNHSQKAVGRECMRE